MNYEEFDLTAAQIRVLRLMEEGWNLHWSNEVSDKRCWLQNGDREYTVPAPTVRVLEELGIIKQDNAIPLGTFHFVDAE